MCGHVGMAGIIGHKEEKAFRTLLIMDTLRGEHSTGVASVSVSNETNVLKTLGDPFQLFEMKSYDKIVNRRANKVLIGHNRYATQGKINRANAHPFEFDNIVGAHNGTLTNKWNLPGEKDFDVDSEALYSLINDKGLEEAMSYASGAWALVYYDKKKDSLNFLRNKERTLFYVKSKNNSTIFWASESWMLSVALTRYDIDFNIKDIIQFEENLQYSFEMTKRSEIAKPRVRKVEGKTYVPPVNKVKPYTPPPVHSSPKAHHKTIYISNGEEKEYKVVKAMRDENGSKYAVLIDTKDPLKDVRMYQGENSLLLRRLPCTIKTKIVVSCTRGKEVYYKTNSNNYSFVTNPVEEEKEEASSDSPFRPVDRKTGEVLDESKFNLHYSSCSWCSTDIDYEEECHIHGETVLCQDCMKDAEVVKYIPSLRQQYAIN